MCGNRDVSIIIKTKHISSGLINNYLDFSQNWENVLFGKQKVILFVRSKFFFFNEHSNKSKFKIKNQIRKGTVSSINSQFPDWNLLIT
jgi:hypothetical protein